MRPACWPGRCSSNRRVYDGRHEIAFVQTVMAGGLPSILDALAESRNAIDELRWSYLVALEPIIAKAMRRSARIASPPLPT